MPKNKLHFKLLHAAFWFFDRISTISILSPLTLKPKLYLGTLLLISPYFATCGPKKKQSKELKHEASEPSKSNVNQTDDSDDSMQEIMCYISVEAPPAFPGGEDSLRSFIARNVDYPKEAIDKEITGRVYVRFCVTDKGSVNQVSILRGVHPLLDSAAIEVVKKLPKWTPGNQGGKPTNVWYTVPINFLLENATQNKQDSTQNKKSK